MNQFLIGKFICLQDVGAGGRRSSWSAIMFYMEDMVTMMHVRCGRKSLLGV